MVIDYKKLTKKQLEELKSKRIGLMNYHQVKVEAFRILANDVNNEEVERFLKSIRRQTSKVKKK